MSTVFTHRDEPPRVKTPTFFQSGLTPEATAHFIEAIASDKAARLQTLAKATMVLTTIPEWAQIEEINAWFGVPINQIKQLAAEGKVIAKKTCPTLTSSAVIFKVADVRKAINGMMDYNEWLQKRPDLENQKGE